METGTIQDVLELARQSVRESHRETVQTYVRHFCADLPGHVTDAAPPDELLGFVMQRYGFLEEDFDQEVKVRVGRPTMLLPGMDANSTLIETRVPDCPYIVRTLKTWARVQGLDVHLLAHPVMSLTVADGTISAIDPTGKQGQMVSQVHLLVSQIPENRWQVVREDIAGRLRALLRTHRDTPAILERLRMVRNQAEARAPQAADSQAACDGLQFIDWLSDRHFIFLGYGYCPAPETGDSAKLTDGLGLLGMDSMIDLQRSVENLVDVRLSRVEEFLFYRLDDVSPIRSEVALRYFGQKAFDEGGKLLGEHCFIGLYSSRGIAERNKAIPVVSRRMDQVMALADYIPGSHRYRRLYAILDSFPGEDIMYSGAKELLAIAQQINEAETQDLTRAFVRRRPGGHRISVICVVPRSRYSAALKNHIRDLICGFLGVPVLREYERETEDEAPVRMHFYRRDYREGVTDDELRALEKRLGPELETWEEKLKRLIYGRYRSTSGQQVSGASKYLAARAKTAHEIVARYGQAFGNNYRASESPKTALADIALMEKLATEGLQVQIERVSRGGTEWTALRTISPVQLILNDIVPVLELMRLRTTSRLTDTAHPAGSDPVYITSFAIAGRDNEPIADETAFGRLGDIVHKVLSRRLPADPLIGLGYLSGLDWKQIDLLITYRNYFRQVFRSHTDHSVNDALLNHPPLVRDLIGYFTGRFGPDGPKEPAERAVSVLPPLEKAFAERLEAVSVIQEDVVLRGFLSLMQSTQRTNFFKPGRGDFIAIKIHPASVANMPRPCPLYEIYVHAPGVEGIHLRGGMVARGGLRHSDRPDDFRTEIHGLQKTQMTKNAVIVPVGSKGGFVTRNWFPERERMEAEIRNQYEKFISGLLELTDNLRQDQVVPPGGVLRYDGDDPYLVVAADKGTATFSDHANAISGRFGFWLGDAFASGGSNGYDHKKVGITARGAWVNVERHFRELGINIREQSVTVAGIGDMSGDVFGNGMLLNDKMKLVAAFNHRHIFIDPDPDPAASYAERKRMFALPRSNWTDYDAGVISEGGGVFERSAKSITLSPRARKLLGAPEHPISGPQLIRLVLRLQVDLIWFGGIGTYVKASRESQAEAGDPANDGVRVDASELRGRVIGEGANLAITPLGRLEFLRQGGLCNTDFIDNSAGVDISDHEVNLKVLFGRLEGAGTMTRDQRNTVLKEVEEEVARMCLRNNYLQSALVTMEGMRTQSRGVEPVLSLLADLERKGVLDKASEFIPQDDELREETATGRGVPRATLCSLISNTKNDLYRQVLDSDIPGMPFFTDRLLGYFPQVIRERYGDAIRQHALRREIVATIVTNDLVNQAGTTFLAELARESNTELPLLVLRYFKCDELLGGPALRKAVHDLDNVVAAADQYRALLVLENTLRDLVRWWCWNEQSWTLRTEEVEAIKPAFAIAVDALLASLSDDEATAATISVREQELAACGFDGGLSRQIATLPLLRHSFLVLAINRETGRDIAEIARQVLPVGHALHLDVLDEVLATNPSGNEWENRFQCILERECSGLRRDLTRRVVTASDGNGRAGGNGATPLTAFVEPNRETIDALGDAVNAVRTSGRGDGQVPLFIILDDYRALVR